MSNKIKWVIITRTDFSDWTVPTEAVVSCPAKQPWLLLVNGAEKLANIPKNVFECEDAVYRCWIHFGGDGKARSFNKEHWEKALKGDPDANSGVENKGIFGKDQDGKDQTPAKLLASSFAPYTKGGPIFAWQKKFFELAPRVKQLLSGQESGQEEADAILTEMAALWKQAMDYKGDVLKRDAVNNATTQLKQAALLYRLESEMNTKATEIPGTAAVQKAINEMETSLKQAGFSRASISCISELDPSSIDDTVTFSDKLKQAAASLEKLMPAESAST